jgi:hypothetical protein
LREYVQEVPLLAFYAVHPPETVLYIPFRREYFCICISLCEGMDDPAKAVPDLVDRSSRRRFSSGVVYRLPEAAIFEP